MKIPEPSGKNASISDHHGVSAFNPMQLLQKNKPHTGIKHNPLQLVKRSLPSAAVVQRYGEYEAVKAITADRAAPYPFTGRNRLSRGNRRDSVIGTGGKSSVLHSFLEDDETVEDLERISVEFINSKTPGEGADWYYEHKHFVRAEFARLLGAGNCGEFSPLIMDFIIRNAHVPAGEVQYVYLAGMTGREGYETEEDDENDDDENGDEENGDEEKIKDYDHALVITYSKNINGVRDIGESDRDKATVTDAWHKNSIMSLREFMIGNNPYNDVLTPDNFDILSKKRADGMDALGPHGSEYRRQILYPFFEKVSSFIHKHQEGLKKLGEYEVSILPEREKHEQAHHFDMNHSQIIDTRSFNNQLLHRGNVAPVIEAWVLATEGDRLDQLTDKAMDIFNRHITSVHLNKAVPGKYSQIISCVRTPLIKRLTHMQRTTDSSMVYNSLPGRDTDEFLPMVATFSPPRLANYLNSFTDAGFVSALLIQLADRFPPAVLQSAINMLTNTNAVYQFLNNIAVLQSRVSFLMALHEPVIRGYLNQCSDTAAAGTGPFPAMATLVAAMTQEQKDTVLKMRHDTAASAGTSPS